MKKRSRFIVGLLCMAMVSAAGCSEKADNGKEELQEEEKEKKSEENVSEEEQYLSWVQEAWEQYRAEKIRGVVTESTYTESDGTTQQYTTIETVDAEKQQVQLVYQPSEERSVDFYTREGEEEYWYTDLYSYSETGEESTIPCKIQISGDIFGYSYYEKGENPYESNDERDISDLKIEKEGEEEMDGASVEKLKVEYKVQWKRGEMETRKSILEENEWTEEEVVMMEGFSDILDAYIASINKQTEEHMNTAEECAETVYLTSDEHRLVRMEKDGEFENGETDPAVNAFWNWKGRMDSMKDLLSDGVSANEAVRMAKEMWNVDDIQEEKQEKQHYTIVENYVTGDQCEPIGELPADSKEITWTQYQKGEF